MPAWGRHLRHQSPLKKTKKTIHQLNYPMRHTGTSSFSVMRLYWRFPGAFLLEQPLSFPFVPSFCLISLCVIFFRSTLCPKQCPQLVDKIDNVSLTRHYSHHSEKALLFFFINEMFSVNVFGEFTRVYPLFLFSLLMIILIAIHILIILLLMNFMYNAAFIMIRSTAIAAMILKMKKATFVMMII